MSRLLVLRHGPTEWNERGLMQGRADPPLSTAGREQVRRWRCPPDYGSAHWTASPSRRAIETARLMGGDPVPDPRLLELDWGEWQGLTLAALRSDPRYNMAEREADGLDFQPPGGESYRMVQQRLMPFLHDLQAGDGSTVAVCHKGVIRALYALATGWTMTGPPPDKLLNDCCHEFRLDDDDLLQTSRLNLPMLP